MTVNAPTNSNHATTKAYVDGRSSHIFAGDGVTIGNSATVNGNTKISLSNIENSTVDSSITLAGILGTHVSSSSNGVISIGNGIAATNRSAAISETESENWQVVAGGTITGTADLNIAFLVTDSFNHASGILNLGFRCSNGQGITDWFPNNGLRLNWLSRHADINPNHYRIRLINSTTPTNSCSWTLEAYHHRQNYAVSFEVLAASGYAGSNPRLTLYIQMELPLQQEELLCHRLTYFQKGELGIAQPTVQIPQVELLLEAMKDVLQTPRVSQLVEIHIFLLPLYYRLQ